MDFEAMVRQARARAHRSRTKDSPRYSFHLQEPELQRREDLSEKLGVGHVMYVAGLLSNETGARLVDELSKQSFIQLNGRELFNAGGVPHLNGTILTPLPWFLDALAQELSASGLFDGDKPNQALVNRYQAGQGIAAHQDGPTFKPQAAIISLKSSAVLHFSDLEDQLLGCVLLEPNSLVVFSKDAYENAKHWIEPCLEEPTSDCANTVDPKCLNTRQERISITLRSVSHVACQVDPSNDFVPSDVHEEMQRREEWWRRAIGS